ncbi:MAG: T9SS type A sorting domain-containing protein [Flavobacteriales bacterium]|nr:T9SS type A sorting domain-containing protein [Flavobacteriales bacterium]
MKRSVLYLSFLSCVSWLIFSSVSGGRAAAGQDRTGSPVSTGTCSACHSGGSYGPSVTATLKDASSNIVTSYIPGNTYTLEIQVSNSTGSPASYGAQAVALLSGNVQAGSFTAIGSTNQVSNLNGREYPEHQGTDADGFFEYSWVAPTAGSGDVVLYAVGMPVDGTGSTGGDEVSSSISVTFTEAAGICSTPTNLTVTNVTGTSADMSWTTGGASAWETEVVLSGSTPTGNGVATVTTTETITNLIPGTTYDAYVRDVCSSSLMLTGVYDGPLTGGEPKGIELYAHDDIGDLSIYGIGSANNGGGTDGQEFTFPSVSVSAGAYIYVAYDSTGFADYMGFSADYTGSVSNVNGDDAFELFLNGTVIDVFGDINCDPNGGSTNPTCATNVWEYLDGWAYRNNGEVNNMGVFDTLAWTFSGPNATDGCSTNSTCGSVFPNGTFTTTSNWAGPETFTTPCVTITLNETVNDISCNGVSDGNISLSPSGGGTAYSYSWSNGMSTATITGLPANNYDVTVSYGGCSQMGSYTITEPMALSVSVTSTSVSCNGASDGSATVTISGGTSGYFVFWTNGATTANATALSSGTSGCTITDAGGCIASVSVTIVEPSPLTITNPVNTSVSCNGVSEGALSIIASGGPVSTYTYMWSNGLSTGMITGLPANSYAVTVTSGFCSQTMSYTLSEPSAISLNVTVVDATFAGATDGTATAVVSPSSSYTYLWNNAGQVSQVATGLGAGTATVTITENSGNFCSQIASGVVADPAACNITVSLNGTNINCNGGTDGAITASASGGPSTLYSYVWSNGMSTATISGLNAMSYTVTVNSGSCSATNVTTLTEPSVVTATGAITICSGDSVLLGGNYETAPGTYTDVQTSVVSGCDSLVSVSVTVIVGPEAGAGSTMNICQSDLAVDLFDGLTNYLDSNGTWTGTAFGSTILPFLGGADTISYTYTVDDGNGTACSIDSAVVVVMASAALNAGGNTTASACISATSLNLASELANPDTGGVWLDLDITGALTDSIFDVTSVTIGNYNVAYAVPGNIGCDVDTAFITVQIVSAPSAGVANAIMSCEDQFFVDPESGLDGSQDAGGSWTWTNNNGSFAYIAGNSIPAAAGTGDWYFDYTASATGCSDDVSSVTITVNESPDAGTDSVAIVCFNVSSLDLNTLLDSSATIGGTWLDDDATGVLTDSIFAPSGIGIGVYNFTYVAVGISPCVNDSSTVQVTVEICGGITDVNSRLSAEIYPNPSTGIFTLQLSDRNANNTSITISGIDGRELHQQNILSANELIEWKGAAAGIYFVTIKQNGYMVVKRLVIE